LARGFYNKKSEIAFRVLGGPRDPADLGGLLRRRLQAAASLRRDVLNLPERTDAWRWVHGEGDGLSGLVIDVMGPAAVVQIYALGWVRHAELVEELVRKLLGVERVVFKADARSQALEGFRIPDPDPGEPVEIREGALRFEVHLGGRHKTGFFLDQRDNRFRVGGFAKGRRVLDLCTNAGAFALACQGPGKAKAVTAIDLDEAAIEHAKRNARLNKLRISLVHADLFPWLRDRQGAKERFDLVILDPPKLAAGPKERDAAMDTYRDMNRWAASVVEPGGLLATFSCSGAVDEPSFFAAVRSGLRVADRRGQVLQWLGAAPDHPVVMDHPEGRYLKGLLLRLS
jgi:23S rRNA (cytosine1962-C5)-methyltransferase